MPVIKISNDARSEAKAIFDEWRKDAKHNLNYWIKNVRKEKRALKRSTTPKIQRHTISKAEKELKKAEKDFEGELEAVKTKISMIMDDLFSGDTEEKPKPAIGLFGNAIFIFQNCIYRVEGLYTEEEKSLLVQAEHDKERAKFEKLKRKFELAQNLDEKPKRKPIPEDVRVAVWRRDQGTCVKCGSRERLEYDHIIPVVEGGGDTVRNIELLCESCNRSKGAKIQ